MQPAYNHSTLYLPFVVKGFRSLHRRVLFKAHFPRHIKFFSFVNDFLMFSRLSVYCFFHGSFTARRFLSCKNFLFFAVLTAVESKNRCLFIKFDLLFAIFDVAEINGKLMNVFFPLTHRDSQ